MLVPEIQAAYDRLLLEVAAAAYDRLLLEVAAAAYDEPFVWRSRELVPVVHEFRPAHTLWGSYSYTLAELAAAIVADKPLDPKRAIEERRRIEGIMDRVILARWETLTADLRPFARFNVPQEFAQLLPVYRDHVATVTCVAHFGGLNLATTPWPADGTMAPTRQPGPDA